MYLLYSAISTSLLSGFGYEHDDILSNRQTSIHLALIK